MSGDRVLYVDGILRGDVTCPACGLIAQHDQRFSARRVGWLRKRWVATFRCSSCGAPFDADVPATRGQR